MLEPSTTFETVSDEEILPLMEYGVVPISIKGFLFSNGGETTWHLNLRHYQGVTKCQLQPKGKKQVTTGTDSPKVAFQTEEHGAYFRTFETELIQSSKVKEEKNLGFPPSQYKQNLNQ